MRAKSQDRKGCALSVRKINDRRSLIFRKLTHHRADGRLGVAVNHDGVVVRKERVFDSREAGSLSALQDEDRAGLVRLDNR